MTEEQVIIIGGPTRTELSKILVQLRKSGWSEAKLQTLVKSRAQKDIIDQTVKIIFDKMNLTDPASSCWHFQGQQISGQEEKRVEGFFSPNAQIGWYANLSN